MTLTDSYYPTPVVSAKYPLRFRTWPIGLSLPVTFSGSIMASEQSRSDHIPLPQANYTPYRPFESVPPEVSSLILSLILSLAWASYHGDDSVDRFRFPSILCMIDQYFNHITLSTPILWSYLRVTSVNELEHIQGRIKRKSGALPLDLYLMFERVAHDDARTLVERTIMQCPSRFQKITLSYLRESILEIPHYGGFWDHLRLLDDYPLQATRFAVDCQHAPPLAYLPPFASSLRHLTLTCNQLSWSQNFLPTASLEGLSIRETGSQEVSTATIIQFLKGSFCHSLRSLSLSYTLIEDVQGALLESCVLESLEYFRLAEFYLWEFVMLFSSIRTPNLQHLCMNIFYDELLPGVLATAWDALQFPSIHKLTLQDFCCDTTELIELIQKLPESIKCLEIIKAGPNGPLEAFQDPSAAVVCGQLHRIVTYDVPLGALVPLIEGRCPSLRGLETRYKEIAKVHTWEEFSGSLDILKALVPELRISEDGGDPNADERTGMTFEQLAASFNNKRTPNAQS